jgi:hypothetical protein
VTIGGPRQSLERLWKAFHNRSWPKSLRAIRGKPNQDTGGEFVQATVDYSSEYAQFVFSLRAVSYRCSQHNPFYDALPATNNPRPCHPRNSPLHGVLSSLVKKTSLRSPQGSRCDYSGFHPPATSCRMGSLLAYPKELRIRVVNAVENGDGTLAEISALFGVGPTFIKKMLRIAHA